MNEYECSAYIILEKEFDLPYLSEVDLCLRFVSEKNFELSVKDFTE